MVKLKLSPRSKHKTGNRLQKEKKQNIAQTTPTEYHETLYSEESDSKNETKQWQHQRWENAETIEHNVDHIHKNTRTTVDHSTGCLSDSDVNKKIDWILAKKKKKI